MTQLSNHYKAYIYGGLQFTGIHEKIAKWIENIPGAHFNKTTGITWVNGVVYYHNVIFLDHEDLVAFKLTFAGYVSS